MHIFILSDELVLQLIPRTSIILERGVYLHLFNRRDYRTKSIDFFHSNIAFYFKEEFFFFFLN